MTPRQSPVRRQNPSGRIVWVARFKGPDGRRQIAKPAWNGGKGSFDRKSDAQRAIDEALQRAYGLGVTQPDTIGNYFEDWTNRHPRAARTNATNEHRVSRVLDVKLDGRPLREWRFDELRRRHVNALIDHMLREQGRAVQGVRNILGSLSVMCEDAIDDEVAGANHFKGIRLRKSDPRAQKSSRPVRVWTFEQMHEFAAAMDRWEPMGRILADCGLRLGELLPLEQEDWEGSTLTVRQTAHEGVITAGTKTDHGEATPGRVVPVPAGLELILARTELRTDTTLLLPTATGKLWRERNFYRDVWYPAQKVTGMDARPHEFRHSFVSNLRAAGIQDADLADVTGHTVETMIGNYTHPLRRSYDRIREVIG